MNDEVIPETILAKINNEIPLLIPFSVIISPNHINSIVPTVRAKADDKTIAKLDTLTTHGIYEFIKYTIPIDCKNANGNVNHLVYCCIFILPVSHSSFNSSK
jgi:hypothetical protein